MHLNGTLLFRKYALDYFKYNLKVLEIGPFGNPSYYKQIVNNNSILWTTLDIGTNYIGERQTDENFVLASDPYRYPFDDNTFDIILSDQVIAHVELFWIWMAELKRIVKPKGKIITIAAASYPQCPSPVDCWRIFPDGMKALNNYLELETILSIYDSLELEYFNYSSKLKSLPNFRVPSESISTSNTFNPKLLFSNKVKIFYNKVLRYLPFFRRFMNSVRIAYDTITIAEK